MRAFRYTFVIAHILGFIGLCALQACTYNQRISQFSPGIAEICEAGAGQHSYTWQGQVIEFDLLLTDDPDQLYDWCGDAYACTDGSTIWAPAGPTCPQWLAHELNHPAGNDWVDASF